MFAVGGVVVVWCGFYRWVLLVGRVFAGSGLAPGVFEACEGAGCSGLGCGPLVVDRFGVTR